MKVTLVIFVWDYQCHSFFVYPFVKCENSLLRNGKFGDVLYWVGNHEMDVE